MAALILVQPVIGVNISVTLIVLRDGVLSEMTWFRPLPFQIQRAMLSDIDFHAGQA
jgi:hypothetical protein